MESLHHFLIGLYLSLQPINLFYCFTGVLIGTLVGVLPGIGPVAAISILLPTTFHVPPVSAIIMLAGIYYGAQYGGSTTSILVNIPGEASSVITCLDGYQMARKGRAGPALAMAACSSFIAGTISIIGLQFLAPPLVKVALKFGPPEYFSLMLVGLSLVTYLAQKSVAKAVMMASLGLILSTVGLDPISGAPRYTLNITELRDGIGMVPLAMGVFGISEVFMNFEEEIKREVFKTKIRGLFPTLKDWKDSMWPLGRGSIIGFFLGVLPGGGPALASFVSYGVEKRLSSHPEKFGTGIIEGVAAPEAANNAAAGGSFIPFMTLGIPSNVVMAILLGAMMIQGVQPGPLLMVQHPDLFWGVIASMYIGNILLLILNLPLIGLWVQILRVPYPILFPFILFFCMVGAFSLNNNTVDVLIMIFFGFFGYILRKFEFEMAPLVLAFILGNMIETNLRQSLIISKGSLMIFITHPITAAGILLVIFILISPLISWVRGGREVIEKLRDS
jgi:putative tricarboxylic transport membrane protein